MDLRQPVDRDLQRIEDLVRPASPAEIQKERPGRVGGIGRRLTRQQQPDVIFRRQHPPGVAELDRFDVPQPEDGGRLMAGQRWAAADLDQAPSTDLFADVVRLRGRTPVAAEDCGPNRCARGVDKHAAPLAGHTESGDLARNLPGHGRQDLRRGTPPIVGVLFRPAGTRRLCRVSGRRRGGDGSGLIDRDGVGAGGPDVETEQH